MRRVPVLDRMLIQKLHAIGACTAMLRQKSADPQMDMLLKVKSDFSPCSQGRTIGGRRQQVDLSRHLWGNKSFPHLLSHVRGYLSARERMRLCSVSRHWNDATANLTISRLEVLQDATLTDANFRSILAKHKSLRYVNILGCCRLTDGSLENIAVAVPKLRELNISYCLQITDHGLAYLRQCENLRRLHTAACNKITEEAMEELYRKLTKLQRPFMPIPRLTRQPGAYGWKPRMLNGFDEGDEDDEKGSGAKRRPNLAPNLDLPMPFRRDARKKTSSMSSVDSRSRSRSNSPSFTR
uniref:F-box/LRR-repeat protein 15-like leucin rich repeat domain-containing protein n=1 Tax=Lotharella globosa TaxID=91324 RepID=A0A7S3YGM0_9EUKA|mmetsp:Transcript_15326/g.31095  ORF Transcript_15326/g.31095 Transcript_15326/m.31095 type:complete len:296 (-) Transcript_15326:259-1146(-)